MRMRCVQNGVPRPLSVQWTRGNLPVTNLSRILTEEDDELTLTVLEVQADDNGTYECTAQNQLRNGTMSQEVVGKLTAAIACGEWRVYYNSFIHVHIMYVTIYHV